MSDVLADASRREPMMHDATSATPRWTEQSLVQLTLVRFKEFLREPEAVFWTFAFPVILALGLGIAFRNKPADVLVVGVVGGTPAGDSIAATLGAASGFRVKVLSDDSASRALRTGEVALVAAPTGAGRVEYRFDDTRPEGRTARAAADDALQRAAGRRDPVAVSEAHVRDKGSRYIDFVVPGLLGMNIMGGGIWGLGFAIVEARRKNLLKRLVSTPMRRAHYLASFLFSRFVFLILEVAVLVGSAALFFDVPVRGSLLQLFVVCLLAALAFGGIGLLIASRARTIEGVSGLMNLAMMPMWVLSGVFFSSANFPQMGAAVHQGAAAHGDERRPARDDVAGRRHHRGAAADRRDRGVAGRHVHAGVAAVPLALMDDALPGSASRLYRGPDTIYQYLLPPIRRARTARQRTRPDTARQRPDLLREGAGLCAPTHRYPALSVSRLFGPGARAAGVP